MFKKIAAMALVCAMALTTTGCSLFVNESVVKFTDEYQHEDPSDMKGKEKIALKREGFEVFLEEMVNAEAYPNTLIMDEEGNITGMYDYDETTGLAYGWTDVLDGSYVAFEEGEEVDLGKPDQSKMIDIPGTVTLGVVVYGEGEADSAPATAYVYAFLTDPAAADLVTNGMKDVYDISLSAEDEKTLLGTLDSAYIETQFEMGGITDNKTVKTFAMLLQQTFGAIEVGSESAFKPYEGHEDPADLDFDERVVLTAAGEAAMVEEYIDYVPTMSIYLYGKEGKIVGQYIYYECKSAEAAEELIADNYFMGEMELVEDDVIKETLVGAELEEMVTSFIGYSVLKDDTLEDFTRMTEETYFASVCK